MLTQRVAMSSIISYMQIQITVRAQLLISWLCNFVACWPGCANVCQLIMACSGTAAKLRSLSGCRNTIFERHASPIWSAMFTIRFAVSGVSTFNCTSMHHKAVHLWLPIEPPWQIRMVTPACKNYHENLAGPLCHELLVFATESAGTSLPQGIARKGLMALV